MKTLGLNKMLSLFFLLSGGIAVYGQVSQSEVPGDHFSLEGALELFKKSASPEEFERLLNSADARVNNLDLNGDGDIDYIKVIDRNEGNVHAFILQAIVSERESQDIAVIELEKLANGKAVLQITGDTDIYGIETIIEPTEEVRINAGTSTSRNVVNVWSWPSVQYIYSPYYYTAWMSPWGWSMRPAWWHTWRPVDYYVYNPWWHSYRPYFSVCYTHRVYAQHIYRPYRTTSVIVHDRHNTQIVHYRSTRGDDDRNGRSKYDDNRSNDRQNNNAYHNDTNGRQRSASGQQDNSRSSYDRSQQQDRQDFTRRSSVSIDKSSSGNRSTPDAQRTPDVSQPSWTGQQRQDVSRKWSGGVVHNNGSRQLATKPSHETRSIQRFSTVQQERRGSGSPNIQRSGISGGTNKSSSHKRGRQ